AAGEQGSQPININTADSTLLQTLTGIGEATAKKIIDYREKNGPFKNIEDIKNVSGIGDKKFEALADMICV
ncbi:MAG TPA: competence protein ComEA, partial [Coriobacteriia bacterium]|nr:competence protein ComEA [Coriobacteriia bacterium]